MNDDLDAFGLPLDLPSAEAFKVLAKRKAMKAAATSEFAPPWVDKVVRLGNLRPAPDKADEAP